MAEEKIPGIMRDCFKAMEKGEVEKMLAFFTEDGVWVCPTGTFKGKEELRRYFTWMAQSMRDVKVTETGNGIIVQGNKAFVEHVIAGTMDDMRAEVLAMCAWEFSDGKVKEVRSTFDRLLMAKQAAKGWLAKWMVNMIVKQSEKGLH